MGAGLGEGAGGGEGEGADGGCGEAGAAALRPVTSPAVRPGLDVRLQPEVALRKQQAGQPGASPNTLCRHHEAAGNHVEYWTQVVSCSGQHRAKLAPS